MSLNKRKIALDHAPPLHLAGEGRVGAGRLGYDEQPRGVLIKAVYDARPVLVLASLYIRGVLEQCVHECAGGMAGSRMDDYTRLLVHHEHVVIFIDDLERWSIRRGEARWLRDAALLGRADLDAHAGLQQEACLGGVSIDPHLPRADRRARSCPRISRHELRERHI
jgi:hypothetical protein